MTPFVKRLLIGLFVIFVTTVILENWAGIPIVAYLALDPRSLGLATLWQVVTYVLVTPPQFLFSALLGLLFLWWCLSPFEERYGSRRAAQLCLASALAGGIPAVVLGLLLPDMAGPVFGVNTLILGSIAAFAWAIRHSPAPILFFGIVPMRPIHLIIGVLGLSLLFFLINKNLSELVADVGAVGGGILFVSWMTRPRSRKPPPKKDRPRRNLPFQVIQGGGQSEDDERPKWLN